MPPKHAHKEPEHQDELSEEDKKILEEHHKNENNPDHPAHKDHPEHESHMKKLPKRFGRAAVFGAGATAGKQAFNAVTGN